MAKIEITCKTCRKNRLVEVRGMLKASYEKKSPHCHKCGFNKTISSKTWFKKGNIPWSTGLKYKNPKVALAHKGKHFSPQTEFKEKDIRLIGKNNVNWRGGITPLKEEIRKSFEYKKWRILILKKDNYTCQICNIRGGKLNADHIKAFSIILYINNIKTMEDARNCIELWSVDNGRTLCKPCHEETDSYLNCNIVREYLNV